jgi:hypothetical protein
MPSSWFVVGAAVGVFYLAVAVRRVLLRPRPIRPGPATPDLRDEPPAVVNLLTHGLRAPQAASATLLDLAARRAVEIIEVAPGPTNTRIRLRGPGPDRPTAYELRVLQRLRRVAGTGAVTVAELTGRYAEGGDRWHTRLTREVQRDARRAGLTRSSDAGLQILGGVVAGLVATVFAIRLLAAPQSTDDEGPGLLGLAIGVWVFTTVFGYLILVLSVDIVLPEPDRMTAQGRAVAAHWLGVAAWLHAHEPLRDLPPAAVAVWDRYLAYGAALGVMPHAVNALDLETTGHRDVLWSDHGGRRRQVHVSYLRRNRLLRPIGRVGARPARFGAVIALIFWSVVLAVSAAWVQPYHWWRVAVAGVAAVQLVRAVLRLILSLVDIYRPVTVTGTLIDITIAGETKVSDDRPGLPATLPTHYHMVIDDGSTDQLRPWIVNRDIARGRPVSDKFSPSQMPAYLADVVALGFQVGDTVTLRGERFSRYAGSLRRARKVNERPRTSESQPPSAVDS